MKLLMNGFFGLLAICGIIAFACGGPAPAAEDPAAKDIVGRFAIFEASFADGGEYSNPFVEAAAHAEIRSPAGEVRHQPLFWDGGDTWRLRVSPDAVGQWTYRISSDDEKLDGHSGSFRCVPSELSGSIQPLENFTRHFQYQDGKPMWFMGDTAWALFTDNAQERHDRTGAERYLATRASQGFNVVHSMMLSEAGWGNSRGLPFTDMAEQSINPAYWQEVDRRIAHANLQGLVVGLAIAWADKRKQEPFAWRRFPDVEARKRYARYIAARFGAYHVYFLVSGEWHGEVRTRPSTADEVRKEFIEIGNALDEADGHDRMIGIHPMTAHGSVREFNEAKWMSFGDYQQSYSDLHQRILEARKFNKPVVNSEYGYHLRDSDGDGTPDKDNSTSLESIRHASWDIVMAGGYLVTGFGTTYFGGHRDPGPFDIDAAKNDDWERQIQYIQRTLGGLDWWLLAPSDDAITCATVRGKEGKQLDRIAPPKTAYWLLAQPGNHYLGYVRGTVAPVTIRLGQEGEGNYRARLINLRTGEVSTLMDGKKLVDSFTFTPPDEQDWLVHLMND